LAPSTRLIERTILAAGALALAASSFLPLRPSLAVLLLLCAAALVVVGLASAAALILGAQRGT
jgi:hypothetical protein